MEKYQCIGIKERFETLRDVAKKDKARAFSHVKALLKTIENQMQDPDNDIVFLRRYWWHTNQLLKTIIAG